MMIHTGNEGSENCRKIYITRKRGFWPHPVIRNHTLLYFNKLIIFDFTVFLKILSVSVEINKKSFNHFTCILIVYDHIGLLSVSGDKTKSFARILILNLLKKVGA